MTLPAERGGFLQTARPEWRERVVNHLLSSELLSRRVKGVN